MYKEKIEEIVATYEVGLSLPDIDIDWLVEIVQNQQETIKECQSSVDSLSMAHDSLHRELSTYKESLPKDKHTLIKNLIALNAELNFTEEALEGLDKAYEREKEQNKQMKDAYKDRESDIEYYQKMLGIDFEDMAIELPVERIQGDKIRVLEQQNKRYKELMRKSLPFILADIDLSNEIQDVLEESE